MEAEARRPLWVRNGHRGTSDQCPLYPQKADIAQHGWDVRFVPKADIGPISYSITLGAANRRGFVWVGDIHCCRLDGSRAGPFGGELNRVAIKVIDVYIGVDDSRNTV
jgi:hypothetical protein